MDIQEYYKFQPKEFDDKGFHFKTQMWFMDLIKDFEVDFHQKFPHCYANHLFSNNSTMLIINKAMNLNSNESSGMDLIDGEVDLDTSLEIDTYSEIKTVYAIGSKLEQNMDEPIFLVVNDKIPDGVILLKYIPDCDSENTDTQIPVEVIERIKVN